MPTVEEVVMSQTMTTNTMTWADIITCLLVLIVIVYIFSRYQIYQQDRLLKDSMKAGKLLKRS